ncbi:MAG: 2-hydroxychromene-2-carboxylate isomerase, partial [Chloroflexota bacterium]
AKMAHEAIDMQRFIEKHRVAAFNYNPHFPVNTLRMMRAALVAQEAGKLMDYVEAGFHHMWEAPKKMDDPEVMAAAFSESGFDGAALIAGTQNPEIKAKLIANTQMAVDRGAFGAPTFYVGNEMFFGKDRLDQVEEEILKQG